MDDLTRQLEDALKKAAEYELLGSLSADPAKRAEYRTLAEFKYSAAHELRKLLTPDAAHPIPQLPFMKTGPVKA